MLRSLQLRTINFLKPDWSIIFVTKVFVTHQIDLFKRLIVDWKASLLGSSCLASRDAAVRVEVSNLSFFSLRSGDATVMVLVLGTVEHVDVTALFRSHFSLNFSEKGVWNIRNI